MHKIAVVGTGYVGLVGGAGLADFGNSVVCVDRIEEKIRSLHDGEIPFYEPGLSEVVKRNVREGRLRFTTDIGRAIAENDVVFCAVGTPEADGGDVDMSQVDEVAAELGASMTGYRVVVQKSTVPVGTARRLRRIIEKNQTRNMDFDVVSNPEFLREGSAVEDFMRPDRVVVGADSERAFAIMRSIYAPLYLIRTPIVETTPESAELIKYASNAFLATKISFINEVANICERLGADVQTVAYAMGLDKRIGPKFLHAGAGYGGSCFPKDTKALVHIARQAGDEAKIVSAAVQVNEEQKRRMVDKVVRAMGGEARGKTVGLLGLAFKPNTDDMRYAASIVLAEGLLKQGARIRAFDPAAMDNARLIMPSVDYVDDAYAVADGADAIVLVTEWNEFRQLDIERLKSLMKSAVVIDCRNIYDPIDFERLGFSYVGVGRGSI
ncbi:MAG: UDP-glucose/GDP-mannose dehydrogenase family protein [Candidatus Eisenbacteria bacterium]|nr:UDP-glucose/GDP-mannose dehydrogenase family protein [Candidatus Eisenbacteria bacterium]